MIKLTINLSVVGAAVQEDANSIWTTIADLVSVYLDVVATLGGDNAVVEVVIDLVVGDCAKTKTKGVKKIEQRRQL